MKKGILMMLCLSLLITAPACYKKNVRSENGRPAKVKKTKTYTKKEKKNGKVIKQRKTEKKVKNIRPSNDRPMRTGVTTAEDMTTTTVTR